MSPLEETAKLVADLLRAGPDGPADKSADAIRHVAEEMRAKRAAVDAVLETARAKGISLSESEARRMVERKAYEDKVRSRRARLEEDARLQAELFGGVAPDSAADPEWDAIVHAYWRWCDRRPDGDDRPPKDDLIADSGLGRDAYDKALRRHGVKDARRLAMRLRTDGRPAE